MRFSEFFYANYGSMLTESKQEITNLGYPQIITNFFYDKFGKNSYVIAKWYKDTKKYQFEGRDQTNWFLFSQRQLGRGRDIQDLIKMYNAADNNSPEQYAEVLNYLEISYDISKFDEYYLQRQKTSLAEQIYEDFYRDYFFAYQLIKDIENGIIKDVAPYKNLEFSEAQDKYDEKLIFKNKKPIKEYSNGYKWIDVGAKCHLVGKLMNNCGSSGVMGTDPNRTIIALFDENNKPHVVTVYHPSEHRISGDESNGSRPVKEKYHEYVLDLADHLHATFDADKTKSKLLKLKYLLKGNLKNIERIEGGAIYDEYYKIILNDGRNYYTNTHIVISEEDIKSLKRNKYKFRYKLENNTWKDYVITVLKHQHDIEQDSKDWNVRFIPLREFVKTLNN